MSSEKSPEQVGAPDVGKEDKIVVEKDEAEELLPGWKKEVKIRKTGSATKVDRYYTDPVTGYIFRSLKEVQRYLKTGELGRLAIKPKIEEREKPSELKEQASETLRNKRGPTDKSELPAHASKRLAGINSDAVLPSPSQPKTRQATRLAGIKVDAPSPSQSLPEPKTRQATRLAGVAVDAPPSPPEPKTRQATRLVKVEVDASLPSPSPPPPPQEPKTPQATRLAEGAVGASLPSPSPPEPKTHQATRLAGVTVDAPSPSPSPSPLEPKTRQATRLAGVTVDAQSPSPSEPKTRQATQLAEVSVDASPPGTRTNHQSTRQSAIKIDASVPSSPPAVPKTRQAACKAGIKIDSPQPLPPDSKTHKPTLLTGAENGPFPPQPEPKTRQTKRVCGIRDDASPPQPKTRRATRQAGIKINSPPPSPPDTRTSRQATRTRLVRLATPKANDKNTEAERITDKHNENADMDANSNHNLENLVITPPLNQETNAKQEPRNILPPVAPKEHNKQIETRPTTSPSPEAHRPRTVVPPVNVEKQKSPVVNPTISNPVSQDSYSYGSDMKPDSSINFSLNDLWTDPCIEFAVKTLTGAIPFTDLNKVENFTAPSEVPLEELWTDPCIEFAVKTLTGAIPVGEDDYLLHRPASSTNPQGPHNFSSPMNVCQTDVLSKHYESGHKNKQQDSVFPTLGNGGLQKSGKFVNGSIGQCSRSWFFQ